MDSFTGEGDFNSSLMAVLLKAEMLSRKKRRTLVL